MTRCPANAFIELDHQLNITYLDFAAAHLLRLSPQDGGGRSLASVLPQPVAGQLLPSLEEARNDPHRRVLLLQWSQEAVYEATICPAPERISLFLRLLDCAVPNDPATLLSAEHEQRLLAETLSEVTLALASKISLQEVLDEILRQLQRLVPYRTAHIMLLEGDTLRIASWRGYREQGGEELIAQLTQKLADFPLDAGVVRERRPRVIPDTHQEPDWVIQPETAWVRSHIVAPITHNERVLGLIRLDSPTPGTFSSRDLARLLPLANAAAIALENARLYEQATQELAERQRAEAALRDSLTQLSVAYQQAKIYAQELKKEVAERKEIEQTLRRRNRDLTLLNRVIAASASAQTPEELLGVVVRELSAAIPAANVLALLARADRRGITAVSADAVRPDVPLAEHLLPGENEPVLVPDIQAGTPAQTLVQSLFGQEQGSLLVLPLPVEDKPAGYLLLHTPALSLAGDEVELARQIAHQVAGALSRIRLLQTRLRLTTAIEQTAEIVAILDSAGRIEYVNPAFERVTGYSLAEAAGHKPADLLQSQPYPTTEPAANIEEIIRGGQVWHGRLKNRRKDGKQYIEETTISPVWDRQGKIVNYVIAARDVTEALLLEAQYRQAQKMEAIGLLAGGIAHDFNNLLTAINGFAELLQQEIPTHETGLHGLVNSILATVNRASSLVRQLLTFSRKQEAEPRLVSLNRLVLDMTGMLRRIIGEHIQMDVHLSDALWPVQVDPHQLEHAIVNLVVNAHDAMPDGGKLTLRTENRTVSPPEAERLGLKPGDYVTLSVEDTGIGMDDQTAARIFEPFFTTKAPEKGTGLGLSTVFGIVRQNGGSIQVESRLGQGSRFTIYLPRLELQEPLPAEASTPARPVKAEALPGGSETILLAEDDAAVRALAGRVLSRQGYRVLAASNGDEALEIARKNPGPIHLLLTDTVMPRLSGESLAHQLRTLYPQVRILFTSGYTEKHLHLRDMLAEGETGFLPKPFTASELLLAVREILDR